MENNSKVDRNQSVQQTKQSDVDIVTQSSFQVLLVQDRQDLREKIAFLVESSFGGRVIEAIGLVQAMELVQKSTSPFQLIIYDFHKGSPEEEVMFWVKSENIPILYCLSAETNSAPDNLPPNVVKILNHAHLIDELSATIEELAQNNVVTPNKQQEETMCRIKTNLLLSVSPLKGDLFIKLSNSKFVRIFHAGDAFDIGDLEKYTIKKGIEYLYISRDTCLEFAERYRAELAKILDSETLSGDRVAKTGGLVMEVIHELNNQIGFTREVQELAKTQVMMTVKTMSKDPGLVDIFRWLKANPGKYIPMHSTFCAYVACSIASQLKWSSATTYHKLILAAYLHDLTLNNHDLAKVESLAELDKRKKDFSDDERRLFREHPNAAAALALRMTEVPPDVDTIIRQHHEKPDGTGFPRGLTHTYIAPLSSIFIVAHDLTDYVTDVGNSFNVEEFLKIARAKYKSSHFKKILASLEFLKSIKMSGLSSTSKM